MTNIVLDKCFLQGSTASRVQELAGSHRLLVSDALFYELITADEPVRARCFAKFPKIKNPVDLVKRVGTMVKIEIQTHHPAGKPSEHRIDIPFQFNPELVKANYHLPEAAKQSANEIFLELREDSERTLELALSTTASFFPNLLKGTQAERAHARSEAEQLIAAPGSLLPFLGSLEVGPEGRSLPIHAIDERWAIYRWLQVQMLFTLDLYVKFQGKVPVLGARAWERLEHDVLDAQVLALGCLEGAFATRETKLIRWWRLLCPNGILYE